MNDKLTLEESLSECQLCGSKNIKRLYEPDIVLCEGCQAIFRSPRPTQEEIKKHYDSGVTFDEWIPQEESRTRGWKRRLKTIFRFAGKGELLDIGTGDGHFLTVARDAGFEVEGTELSDFGISRCILIGLKVHQGQLSEINFSNKQYDIITIWHVLEHVPNPGEVLRQIYSLLKSGGILVVAVPNEENKLFRRRLRFENKTHPFGLLDKSGEVHLTHFQPHSLLNALNVTGFKVHEFGVDDLYAERSLRNRAVIAMHKTLARVFRWHFSMAMYVICYRPLV